MAFISSFAQPLLFLHFFCTCPLHQDSDESYLLPAAETPVGAYLNISSIINVAKQTGVDAIHPGYGFLSESAEFAQVCEDNGIIFVGPTVQNLETFGDKTKARELAVKAGVSVSYIFAVHLGNFSVMLLLAHTSIVFGILSSGNAGYLRASDNRQSGHCLC